MDVISIVFCVLFGSAVLFGCFVGFRKLSQIILMRRLNKMMRGKD